MAELWEFIVRETQFVAVWWFTSVGSYGLVMLAVMRLLLALAMFVQARRTQERFDRWLLYLLVAVNIVAVINFSNSTPLTPFSLLVTFGLIVYFIIRWRRKVTRWKPGDPDRRRA